MTYKNIIMKNLFIIFLTSLFLVCCAGTYKQASSVSNQAYIGMPLQEFKQMAGKKAVLETLENGWTIYRMNDYDPWSGATVDTKFFYFGSDGKLAKIDGGVLRQSRQSIDLNIKK
jgi:hypothetical protein